MNTIEKISASFLNDNISMPKILQYIHSQTTKVYYKRISAKWIE